MSALSARIDADIRIIRTTGTRLRDAKKSLKTIDTNQITPAQMEDLRDAVTRASVYAQALVDYLREFGDTS